MATILLNVSDGELRPFLVEALSRSHRLLTDIASGAAPSEPGSDPVDLSIADRSGLMEMTDSSRPEGTARVPNLLVVRQDEAWQPREELEPYVDEIVRIPASKWELRKRVEQLLALGFSQRVFAERLRVWEHHNRFLLERVQGQNEQLRKAFIETVMSLARAAEFRDWETGRHLHRVSYYCRTIAEELGLDEVFLDRIFYASPLHDIGKIGVPDSLLLKAGPLTEEEWSVMQRHSTMGAEILRNSDSPYLHMGEEIASFHHEHWDGGGYPYGLAGEAIPLPARIMKLADVYDALRSARPYKTGLSHSEVVRTIREGDRKTSPDNFDPMILSAFLRRHAEFEEIFERVRA